MRRRSCRKQSASEPPAERESRRDALRTSLKLAGAATAITLGVLAAAGLSNGGFFKFLGIAAVVLAASHELVGQRPSTRAIVVTLVRSVAVLAIGVATGRKSDNLDLPATYFSIGVLQFGSSLGDEQAKDRLRNSLLQELRETLRHQRTRGRCGSCRLGVS